MADPLEDAHSYLNPPGPKPLLPMNKPRRTPINPKPHGRRFRTAEVYTCNTTKDPLNGRIFHQDENGGSL